MSHLVRVLFSIGLLLVVVLHTLLSWEREAVHAASDTVLYAITGDGGMNPSTLYSIDPANGNRTRIGRLGNGGDGEEIAFDPDNGRLLHASGRVLGDDLVLEWVDPSTAEVTPIKASGDVCDEVTGLTYAGGGSFIAGTVDFLLCSISKDGVIEEIGRLDVIDVITGLAFLNGKLYATEWGDQTNLLVLDPGNATIIQTIKLNVDSSDYRFTALVAHPCTGVLYAMMAVGATEIRTPTPRSLVTINPATGRVQVIANVGESFSGLAFGPCNEEGARRTAAASAIGALQALQAASSNPVSATPAVSPSSAMPFPSPVTGVADRSLIQPISAATVAVRPPSTGDAGLLDD
jgi:hypothetical protein